MVHRIWIIGMTAALVIAGGIGYGAYSAMQAPVSVPSDVASPKGPPAGVVQVAADMQVRPEDRVLGSPDAPVTMIEYASLTCSHCASFHNNTLPQLKKDYIDTGKVKLVYRDFPFDELGLRAATLARCAEPESYFAMLDVLFSGQEVWSRSKNPLQALRGIGRMAGMDDRAFDQCMQNQAITDEILKIRLRAAQEYQVKSTPTFFINGERLSGAMPYEDFTKVLKPLIPDS